nr:CheB methylesterase domain-containing protein [Desulfobacteraceae bacterium]
MPKRNPDPPKKIVSSIEKAEVVVMASSTGGPEILSRIFSILPGTLKAPILLVQHIPATMTGYFAKSLNQKSELDILEAAHGDEILPGKVYIAPGGRHMTVSKRDDQGRRTILLNSRPLVNSVRPSADVLFESVAESYSGRILAVVLTGMGEDGKKGVADLKARNCFCITQTSETCVVYGMPRAVDEAGLSDESLDPLDITQKIVLMAQ